MSRGLNRVQLLGFLGKDPELRFTSGGTIIAALRVATTSRVSDGHGNWVDETEWHNCKAFNRTAEVARDYLRKGSQLYVEGKIKTSSWETNGEKKYRIGNRGRSADPDRRAAKLMPR